MVSAIHFDPVEKKPLYHFHPGSKILSIGTVGCNFSCGFCQNCDISQKRVDEYAGLVQYSPSSLIDIAGADEENVGIAFTYNEPVVYFEYMLETAAIAHEHSFKNIMVTNGFIEPEPLRELLPHIDAFNVDLKSFDNNFYKRHTGGRLLPVLNSLEMIRNEKKHLELTTLIIPGLNDMEDTFREMVLWIRDHLGSETILHLSKYHPANHYYMPATPESTLKNLFNVAKEFLPFVYLGNIYVNLGNNTICPVCGNVLINRTGYNVKVIGLENGSICKSCHTDLKQHIIL
jgi:pyruvate formate lyase activating enzyme